MRVRVQMTSVYELADILVAKFRAGENPIHFGGHFLSGSHGKPKIDEEYFKSELEVLYCAVEEKKAKAVVTAAGKKKPLDYWVPASVSVLHKCYECGEFLDWETNGVDWRCSNPCEFPNGVGSAITELNFPSGKFIVANDLREEFRVTGSFDINARIGTFKTVHHYAKIGLAHGFVGNSNPGVFRADSGHFIIGQAGKTNPKWPGMPISKRVAGIGTDLWWYSICDYDEFVRRAGKTPDKSGHEHYVVACKPGVYEFEHRYGLVEDESFNGYGSVSAYAYFKWVRKPDAQSNYSAHYDNLNVTAGQVIAEKLKNWPDLYNGPDRVQRVADSILCAGGGNDYHPNGFWSGAPEISNDDPAVKIPVFDKKYHWYPFSESCTMGQIAGLHAYDWQEPIGKVNDSFIALAFNVCRCVLVHGAEPVGMEKDAPLYWKTTLKAAQKIMKGLKKKYPKHIPENCKDVK